MVVLLLEKHGEYRPYLSLLAVRETERLLRVGAECLFIALPALVLGAPSIPRALIVVCLLSPFPSAPIAEKSARWARSGFAAACWLRP